MSGFRVLLALYAVVMELVVWLALVPAALIRIALRRTGWRDLRERLVGAALADGERVLVHAVSAGEMVAAQPLVARLAAAGYAVLLSTGTTAGLATARRIAAAEPRVDATVLLPWDRFGIRRWLRASGITGVVLLEAELWPNLLAACRAAGIPLCIANGRLREADVRRYRLARPFFTRLLEAAVWIGAQDERAREAYGAIGANPGRIVVAGDLKLAAVMPERPLPGGLIAAGAPLLVGGSTHPPEEALLLDCIEALRAGGLAARIVLAPRDVRRARHVARAAAGRHLRVATWPGPAAAISPGDWDVLVVDAHGWLTAFYARADVAFVGGTLAPVGGHNLVEPASLARTIVVGPHTGEIASTVDLLRRAGGVVEVETGRDALADALRALLVEPERATRLGRAAAAACRSAAADAERHAGAAVRALTDTGRPVVRFDSRGDRATLRVRPVTSGPEGPHRVA